MAEAAEERMRRYQLLCIILGLFAIFTGCKDKRSEAISLTTPDEMTQTENDEDEKESSEEIYVYVCGAVVQEGVYRLPKGSRIFEAVELAGGFREDAATTGVNQAQVLEDEMTVYVPTIDEAVAEETISDGKVDLNRASKEELMTLSGVGESRAESIIKYREQNGGFQTIEDIMKVSGIKEGLFEKIKDFIKV